MTSNTSASAMVPVVGDPERIPVIVGVGQINDRPTDPMAGLDPAGLMEAALRAAEADAGGSWLVDLDSLALVDQISFREVNPIAPGLATRIGASPKMCEQTKMASGDSPILLLNEAANRIGAGEIRIAAIAGGEALRTAAQRRAATQGTDVSAQNALRILSSRRPLDFRGRYGLVTPVDVYPLYENASRAGFGQTLAEAQAETGEIWSRFSEVAAANPGAWIHRRMSAAAIVEPTADNRPIAHPYTKYMVANSSVNQGAAFLVTNLAEARRRGVPDDRLIYVGMGAAAHEADDPLGRDRYDRSASMAVSLLRALELNQLAIQDIDLVELYSCFPCMPKMARRVIDWPVEKPASVFGGLTFGGGPIGNYMSHAVVSMVLKLRQDGQRGLLFANGGFATHNHTIVLGREPFPAARFPQNFDYQGEAESSRGEVPNILEEYAGPATIETFTVLYERDGSAKWGVIVARTPDGARTLAKVPADDEAGIAFLSDGLFEPVGAQGIIHGDASGDQIWQRSAN